MVVIQSGGGIKKILLIGLILMTIPIVIGGIYFKTQNKQDDKNKDWDTYKCTWPYIFVAGIFVGPKDGSVNPYSNMTQCLYSRFKSIFDTLIKPFRDIIKSIIGILVIFKTSINQIRVVLRFVRDSIRTFARDIYMRLKKSYMQIAFIINRIRKVFKYLVLTLTSLFDALSYVIWTLKSMWKGPMGKIARKLCFAGDTLVTVNGKEQLIKDVKIGGDVTGILEFSSQDTDMYNYKGIIVSGCHYVYEDKWLHVCDSIHSNKVDYVDDKIYCLNTVNNIIMIDGIKFSDYEECDSDDTNKFVNTELFKEYNVKCQEVSSENNYLDGNTKIKMRNENKKIKDISVGDYTNNGKVIGIIKQLYHNRQLYKYKNDIMTGSQLVKVNNDWMQICDIGIKINYNKKYLYHIFTDTNIIETINNIITDYEIYTADETTHSKIINLLN
jgi:hypothetical protein